MMLMVGLRLLRFCPEIWLRCISPIDVLLMFSTRLLTTDLMLFMACGDINFSHAKCGFLEIEYSLFEK